MLLSTLSRTKTLKDSKREKCNASALLRSLPLMLRITNLVKLHKKDIILRIRIVACKCRINMKLIRNVVNIVKMLQRKPRKKPKNSLIHVLMRLIAQSE